MRNEHERARELTLAARVEEISGAERQWLHSHLGDCAACSEFAATLDAAVSAVRMPAVTASSALVQATKRRVRARSADLRARDANMRPLWIAVAMVCAWATLTTGALWAAFAWIGATYRVTPIEWRIAFVFAWIVPSLAASVFLLGSGSRRDTAGARAWEAE